MGMGNGESLKWWSRVNEAPSTERKKYLWLQELKVLFPCNFIIIYLTKPVWNWCACLFSLGYCIIIPPPRLWTDLFFNTRRFAKIAFTPEDFHKIWFYSWRIGSYPWRILWKVRLHPQRMPYFFTLPLKKSSIFITYPRIIPWFLNGGGANIKCNSPLHWLRDESAIKNYRKKYTSSFKYIKRTD